MVNWVVRHSKKIGGPDCIVEIDESNSDVAGTMLDV